MKSKEQLIGSRPKRGERSQIRVPVTPKEVAGQESTVDSVSGAAPAHAIDALLAIQEVDDATAGGGNARGRQWGGEVLDRLEAVRLGLLSGGIPISELRSISELVERQRENVTDAGLQALLDQIELRARVELAKTMIPVPGFQAEFHSKQPELLGVNHSIYPRV